VRQNVAFPAATVLPILPASQGNEDFPAWKNFLYLQKDKLCCLSQPEWLPMYSRSFALSPLMAAVSAALSIFALLPAQAADTELAEVQVSGGRSSAVPVNLPASQAGMDARQIAASVNVINTEDVVKYLPSVQVRKRYIGDRNSIIATRTSGQTSSARSLLYADGVLLATASRIRARLTGAPYSRSKNARRGSARQNQFAIPEDLVRPRPAVRGITSGTTRAHQRWPRGWHLECRDQRQP